MPVLARWINRDPTGLADGANLFVYAGNGPAVHLDPSGMHSSFACSCDGEPPRQGAPPAPDPCMELKKETKCQGVEKQKKPDPKKVYGLTFCSGGDIKIEIYGAQPGDPLRGDKCFDKCVREHEEYHKKQIAAWCPWLCKCYANDPDFDFGYSKFDGDKTKNIWECPAYVVSYLCIKKALDEIAAGKNPLECSRAALTSFQEKQISLLASQCKQDVTKNPPPAPPVPPVYPS